jgi:hypothetical protein
MRVFRNERTKEARETMFATGNAARPTKHCLKRKTRTERGEYRPLHMSLQKKRSQQFGIPLARKKPGWYRSDFRWISVGGHP